MSHTQFPELSRRQLIAAAVGAGMIITAFAGPGQFANAATQDSSGTGLFSSYPLGHLTLHNYMAPSSSAVVTAQIIETANALHIIDTQFVQPQAKEVRDYADAIGKPIARVCLSQWHPDHVLGASQFADVDFITTPDVAADCENSNRFT